QHSQPALWLSRWRPATRPANAPWAARRSADSPARRSAARRRAGPEARWLARRSAPLAARWSARPRPRPAQPALTATTATRPATSTAANPAQAPKIYKGPGSPALFFLPGPVIALAQHESLDLGKTGRRRHRARAGRAARR